MSELPTLISDEGYGVEDDDREIAPSRTTQKQSGYLPSLPLAPLPMPLTEGSYHLTPDTPEIRWKDFAAYPSPIPSYSSSSDETDSYRSSATSSNNKAKRLARAKKELLMVKHWFRKSSRTTQTEERRRPASMIIMDTAKVLASARPHEV